MTRSLIVILIAQSKKRNATAKGGVHFLLAAFFQANTAASTGFAALAGALPATNLR